MVKALRVLTAVVLCATCVTIAEADVTRLGATVTAIAAPARGTAVGYDSVNQVYLIVAASAGVLRGQFVDRNGAKTGAAFVIQANPALYAHFPHVAFSPDADAGAGGFMVAWHQSDVPTGTSIHARVVSYTKGGAIGNDNQVSVEGSYWERYPGIAYSSASREFLITYPRLARGIRAVRVDLTGAALGAPFTIAVNGQNEEWSSVAYNPTNDRYLVVYEGFTTFGTVYARAVQAGTDALLGAGPAILYQGGADYINDVVYNPSTNQFLAVWSALVSKAMLGRTINADLSLPGNVIPISTLWQAYDGLGLAYNNVTQTSFMVSHDATGYEDGGVEIKADGTPVGSGFLVTQHSDTKGNFYPRIAASSADGSWLVSTAHGFLQTDMQLLTGTPVGPPVDKPNPYVAVDLPSAGSVRPSFTVSGWAADLGSSTGSGADAVHVWAWPSSGAAPIFLGATTPSLARADVGAIFGSRFTNSGYNLPLNSVPTGNYLLAVYMHSTVTNTFNAVRTVNISVGGSNPLVAIDTPGNGATVSSTGFRLGGWAVDFGSSSGPGIAAVHIWAFPVGGGTPVFAAAATCGVSRPDVGGIFGTQFTDSGYNATITVLPPGTYDLGVYGLSTVTGTFNVVRTVRVVVQ